MYLSTPASYPLREGSGKDISKVQGLLENRDSIKSIEKVPPGQGSVMKDLEQLSSLLPRLTGPVLELPEATKAPLEELMLEGDLLEVTLDENHSIWQLLQAGQPPDIARIHTLLELEKPEHQGSRLRGQVLEKRRHWHQSVDLCRKTECIFQEEVKSKKTRCSEIKPEVGEEEEGFEEETNHEDTFLTPPPEHNLILKGNQNNLQEEVSSPTTSLPSLTPLLHLSYPEEQEL